MNEVDDELHILEKELAKVSGIVTTNAAAKRNRDKRIGAIARRMVVLHGIKAKKQG